MATATCSALLVAALLCNAPAAPAPITLHGAPISGTVEVYRLVTPANLNAVASGAEQDPDPGQSRTGRPILRNVLIGLSIGCAAGATMSVRGNDDAHVFNCLWVAGVGAAVGAIPFL